MKNLSLLIAISLMLPACTSFSKKDCERTNWGALGLSDGQSGKPIADFIKIERECRDHGIKVDRATYGDSYAQGIKSFCTEVNGEEFARKGGEFEAQCPPSLAPAFHAGYSRGKLHYTVETQEREIRRLRDEVNDLKQQITRKDGEITRLESSCRH